MRAIDLAEWVQRLILSRKVPPAPLGITRGLGAAATLLESGGLPDGLATPAVVMKMDIEGSEFQVWSPTVLPLEAAASDCDLIAVPLAAAARVRAESRMLTSCPPPTH